MSLNLEKSPQDFLGFPPIPKKPEISVSSVEDKIRNAVSDRHTRVDEYFKDFDRLRTGLISKGQFDRCLDQHFGISLTRIEDEILMKKYGSKPPNPGMVNYRKFCETIGATFEPNIIDKLKSDDPTILTSEPLSPVSQRNCDKLLLRIAPYYKYHGISIRSIYEDCDQHNIGLVTESQFHRQFPGPSHVTREEKTMLAEKYKHQSKPGLYNYLKLHQDLEKVISSQEDANVLSKEMMNGDKIVDGNASCQQLTLQEILQKIRKAVFTNGIRTTEFFKDHDKLRSGVITSSQFVSGILSCCGNQANLSRNEVEILINFYQTEDGHVRYKEFCHLMENAFNIPDLEKRPTADVYRPPIGALAKMPNYLGGSKEKKVKELLSDLQETVNKKRLMLYPYFKDFDHSCGYTRGITKTQFSRMFHMLGMNLSPEDIELICKKLEYPKNGDINYPAFCQAIDSEYCGRAAVDGNWNTTKLTVKEEPRKKDSNIRLIDVDELIARIRHDVQVNRIRAEEFFRDFDSLRHGSISSSRFRMGLSAMGQDHLSEDQLLAIVDRFSDPGRQFNVLWMKFLKAIEEDSNPQKLEISPEAFSQPAENSLTEKIGTANYEKQSTPAKKDKMNEVLHIMRQKIIQRRILIKPVFQDFDRHNIGYVTKSQLGQCIAYGCLNCGHEEINLIFEKFSDFRGFNYLEFLEEMQPSEKQEKKYLNRLEQLQHPVQPGKSNEKVDIEYVMEKIKDQVVKRSICVYEFMKDYDKLNTGRMLRTCFPRALDLCSLGLNAPEVLSLTEFYASPNHTDYVDYYQFCDDVESAFTQKGLEKNPTVVPVQFKGSSLASKTILADDDHKIFEVVMHRLADRVRIRRIQLFPLFEDYDRVHNGSVSRSQFHRVLSELELGNLVSTGEFQVLYKKFDSMIGGKHDFNYIQFCDILNDYANFEPYVP